MSDAPQDWVCAICQAMVRVGADEFRKLVADPIPHTPEQVVEAVLTAAFAVQQPRFDRREWARKTRPAPPPGRFDRATYMREYMQKRRAAAKLIPQ